MSRIPLGRGASNRAVGQTPEVKLENRYFESDPTNLEDEVALLCRPGLKKWLEVGSGPIRAIYSCPGTFDEALFVVSGTTLYRVDVDETITSIGTVAGTGAVSMAATAFPFYLYIANGLSLQLYDDATLTTVAVPDGDGIVSVGYIASFVIAVVAQNQEKNGRFYWIEPFETTIDPFSFATAEKAPDPSWQVEVVGDQFWFPGTSSNEVWYPTGDELIPFLRYQGRIFDEGIWEGTILKMKNSVFAVGTDGTVYEITDGPREISTPGIAEQFRLAINAQRAV